MLKQYVRGTRNRKVGVLVAERNSEGKITVGHSKWCTGRDMYNRSLGDKIAIDRMRKGSFVLPADSIRVEYINFLDRCSRYFKVPRISHDIEDFAEEVVEVYINICCF